MVRSGRIAIGLLGHSANPAPFAAGYQINPAILRTEAVADKCAPAVGKHVRMFVLVSLWLAVWAALHIYFVVAVFSNAILFLSYYAADYQSGFVRRGLAGELLGLFPQSRYFTGAYTVIWASIILWLLALAVLMRSILARENRSERKVMLALIIPVLPFAFSYAVYNPHPELFGMTALLAFTVALTKTRTQRSRLIISALYGTVTAVLALVHEAIPLEFSLGAVLAIFIVAKDATHAGQRACVAVAVGPGLVSVFLVAVLGRRDLAAQVCDRIPHRMVENPWAVSTTPQGALDYIFARVQSQVDYHDWVCANVAPMLNLDLNTAFRLVTQVGFSRLCGAFLLGLLFFAGTTWLIRHLSGVAVSTFVNELRGNVLPVALAGALVIPLFMTAVDWTRWWVMLTADVAVVYILYAIGRPEIQQAPSRRNVLIFLSVVLVLALIPIGSANNVGA